MELYDVEEASCAERRMEEEVWPVEAKKCRFPCCLVWTPLPVVSWLAPFVGHVGICREDGTILDFSVSNFINVDKFAFGSPARYLQLDREQVSYMWPVDYTVFVDCYIVL